MKKVTLYKYARADGGVTVSPLAPPEGTPYTGSCRLIADEGMLITSDGGIVYAVVDTDAADGWREIPDAGKGG